MAEISVKNMAEVTNKLEAEPSSSAESRQPDIPALHEQLEFLVSIFRAQEAIGVQFTQEQVKKLEPKELEKYYKRYETYEGTKTTDTVVNSLVSSYARAVAKFVPINDVETLQNEIKKTRQQSIKDQM